MDVALQNRIVSFIWAIADDCLRDVYVRGGTDLLKGDQRCKPSL
jgi:hypothetical protein